MIQNTKLFRLFCLRYGLVKSDAKPIDLFIGLMKGVSTLPSLVWEEFIKDLAIYVMLCQGQVPWFLGLWAAIKHAGLLVYVVATSLLIGIVAIGFGYGGES